MSQLGRRALLGGILLAAAVLVASTPVMSVTPADPAVAVVAPPPAAREFAAPLTEPSASAQPEPERPDYAAAMIAAAKGALPRGVSVGMAVLDLGTGELAVDGTSQFYSASLSKLMLVVDMLDRDVPLSDSVRQLITRALSMSDDNAMNALWVKFDGYNAMTRVAQSLGMVDTQTTADRSQWGEVKVSPAGFARLYQHIVNEMSQEDREIIVAALSAAPPTAADGFNQFYGLLGGALKAFAKQGWMYYGGRLYLHSTGVVSDGQNQFAVILMSLQPSSTSQAQGTLSSIAEAMLRGMPTALDAAQSTK